MLPHTHKPGESVAVNLSPGHPDGTIITATLEGYEPAQSEGAKSDLAYLRLQDGGLLIVEEWELMKVQEPVIRACADSQ